MQFQRPNKFGRPMALVTLREKTNNRGYTDYTGYAELNNKLYRVRTTGKTSTDNNEVKAICGTLNQAMQLLNDFKRNDDSNLFNYRIKKNNTLFVTPDINLIH